MKAPKAGRPSVFPETSHAVLAAIREGADIPAAARAAGVHRATVYRWMGVGRIESPFTKPYRDFRNALFEARATYRNAALRALRDRLEKAGMPFNLGELLADFGMPGDPLAAPSQKRNAARQVLEFPPIEPFDTGLIESPDFATVLEPKPRRSKRVTRRRPRR